jgi:hypothetical protein
MEPTLGLVLGWKAAGTSLNQHADQLSEEKTYSSIFFLVLLYIYLVLYLQFYHEATRCRQGSYVRSWRNV